jgi:hypothetical protein
MKKLLFSLFALSFFSRASVAEAKKSYVIPNASYYIFEGERSSLDNQVFNWVHNSDRATFYTATGDTIETIRFSKTIKSPTWNQEIKKYLEAYLDPRAPKPQPVKFVIRYFDGWPKVSSRYRIVFYDKHDNIIACDDYEARERAEQPALFYDKAVEPADLYSRFGELDLSIAFYEHRKNNFKHDLYCRQKGMSQHRFEKIIESYLQQSEKTLMVPNILCAHGDSALAREYFEILADWYAYLAEYGYVARYDFEVALSNIIKQIKIKWQPADFDAALEAQKTGALLKQKALLYKKSLSLIGKVGRFFA